MQTFRITLIYLAMMLCGTALSAQEPPKARVSPPASVWQTLGEATVVRIDYSRPAVKGRTIWGDLVPRGKVWRTGANEATTFSASHDVLINGQKLPAGKYALFTIPGEDEWTLIFNKTAEQWGASDYNEKTDALRLTVAPQPAPHAEWLHFGFEQLDGTKATAVLHWEKVRVPFTVETTLPGEKIRKSLKAGLSQTIGVDTRIEISYSRPGVKGREIWGGLVPYGKVWRTGADEATTFSVNGDVLINGTQLPAGTYALFTIPGEDEWTLIFNKTAEQWGAFNYDEKMDALRVTALPRPAGAPAEWFTIAATHLTLTEKVITAAELSLLWEKLAVPFTVALP